MKKNTRFFAILFCIFMFFATSCGFAHQLQSFISSESGYECCIEEDCEICARLQNQEDNFKGFLIKVTNIVLAAAAMFILQKAVKYVIDIVKQTTPLTLKVKLLN